MALRKVEAPECVKELATTAWRKSRKKVDNHRMAPKCIGRWEGKTHHDPSPSGVLLAISVYGNCLTYICVTLARFVHAHTHGLRRRGLHTNLLSSRNPPARPESRWVPGHANPMSLAWTGTCQTQCLEHVLGNAHVLRVCTAAHNRRAFGTELDRRQIRKHQCAHDSDAPKIGVCCTRCRRYCSILTPPAAYRPTILGVSSTKGSIRTSHLHRGADRALAGAAPPPASRPRRRRRAVAIVQPLPAGQPPDQLLIARDVC